MKVREVASMARRDIRANCCLLLRRYAHVFDHSVFCSIVNPTLSLSFTSVNPSPMGLIHVALKFGLDQFFRCSEHVSVDIRGFLSYL
jgi:hypothetical protein